MSNITRKGYLTKYSQKFVNFERIRKEEPINFRDLKCPDLIFDTLVIGETSMFLGSDPREHKSSF